MMSAIDALLAVVFLAIIFTCLAATNKRVTSIQTRLDTLEKPDRQPAVLRPQWFRHMTVTAYCPHKCCCGKWADGFTASGRQVKANGGKFVAAPSSFPFGMLVRIPGYADNRFVPVLDRGGSIIDNRLDVFFADDPESGKTGHELAMEWGIRYLDVEIVEESHD